MIALGSWLDRFVRPKVLLAGRPWNAFRLCNIAGLAVGSSLAATLAAWTDLSLAVLAILGLSSCLVCLALASFIKILAGREIHSSLLYQFVVIALAGGLLRLLQVQPLPYLDVTALALGAFVACGRLGCLMAGCCHGRPNAWGVCYREEHEAAGFPDHLIGVRLIPVQLMESAWIFATVLLGVSLVLAASPPGTALTAYATFYGLGRFCFELLRGDEDHRYLGGLSETQWISLVLVSMVTLVGILEWLPSSRWQQIATLGLCAAALLMAATDGPERRLFHPEHVRQIAELLTLANSRAVREGKLFMGETTMGLRISASTLRKDSRELDIFAFSSRGGALPGETAGRLARLMTWLRQREDDAEFIAAENGVYHLILPAPRSAYAL